MRLVGAGLGCVRAGRKVFSDLSFSVESGAALLITGANGAGKSSLLRMIAGLIRVAAGSLAVELDDEDLTLAEHVHYVGHQDALKPALTLTENLGFWTAYLGGKGHRDGRSMSEARSPADALTAVGLDGIADLPAAYLSAGQRRRLSIARLLTAPRPIWLLDEPTSSLDATAQTRLEGLMREHLAGGGLILAATHAPLGLAPAGELRLGAPA
jgi:heme exporter protein A